jgi:hypothetical protein
MSEDLGPYGAFIRSYDDYGNMIVSFRSIDDLPKEAQKDHDKQMKRRAFAYEKGNKMLVEYYERLAEKVFHKNAPLTRDEKKEVFIKTKKDFPELTNYKKKTISKKYDKNEKISYYKKRAFGKMKCTDGQKRYAMKRLKELQAY